MAGPESLLGVDVGTVFTKVALFEPVDGHHRLIARAQARTSAATHVYEGLQKACAEIELLTGRQLFSGGEPLAGEVSGGRGVEALSVRLSCFPPLKVLATNPDAAAAARAERCLVQLLAPGSLRERVQQASWADWDAIAGSEAEIAAAIGCLPKPAASPATAAGDAPAIRTKLGEQAVKLAQENVPGLADLAAAATEPLGTSAGALRELTQLIAARFGLRLAIADCGASQTTVIYATPQEGVARLMLHERLVMDIPTSHNALNTLHEALQATLAGCAPEAFSADLVVGTGALAHTGRWSVPALTLLNGIRPAGVIQLALDSGGVVGQIAALARSFPDLACEIFERDGLVGLGAAVCPRGSVKPGAKAVDLRWRIGDQPEQQHEVKFGELARVPLGPGQKATLTLHPARQIDIGLNRPGVAATAHVDGGRVGLMVDARRPESKTERQPWEASLA